MVVVSEVRNVQTTNYLFVADDEAFSHQPNLNLVEFSRLVITWCSTLLALTSTTSNDDHDHDHSHNKGSYHRSRAGARDTSDVSQAIGMFIFFITFFFPTNLLFKIRMSYDNDNERPPQTRRLYLTSMHPNTTNGHLDSLSHGSGSSRPRGRRAAAGA